MNSMLPMLVDWGAQPLFQADGLPAWPGVAWLAAWLGGLWVLSRAAAACGCRRHGFWITLGSGTLSYAILAGTVWASTYLAPLLPEDCPPAGIMAAAGVGVSLLLIVPLLKVLRAGYGALLCSWCAALSTALLAGYLVTSATEGFQSGGRHAQTAGDRARAIDRLIQSVND